ncbi:MAG: phosphate ABC transporter permease subunit PstC [Anaerolineae bacterium]|nr:phosphate ABC transporter permease subunit PstC [Anaerolineae bacterium]
MTNKLLPRPRVLRSLRVPLLSRRKTERIGGRLFLITTALPLVLVVVIALALLARTYPILETQPIGELLFGQTWHPLRGEFGFYPFIIGTLWVTLVSMLLAVPLCLLSAIYLAEYAHPAVRAVMKPLLDLLAGIPSVIYGVWGLVAIVPWVQNVAAPASKRWLDFLPFFAVTNTTGYSILAGGIVLAVMVIPVIIAVTYEVMEAVPNGLRESSLAVGATRWQTIKHVVMPKAAPGVLVGVVLGFSRAFGETMAVLMVVGNVPRVPSSIFDPAYPLTALIANNYGEMLSIPLYDSALMGAALVLLVVVLIFNLGSALLLQHFLARTQA